MSEMKYGIEGLKLKAEAEARNRSSELEVTSP